MKKNTFIVTGVELPVRTQTTKINKQRWEEFTARLESELNGVVSEGHSLISHQIIEGHGVVLVAQRKEEQEEQPTEEGEEPDIEFNVNNLPEPLRSLLRSTPPCERLVQLLLRDLLALLPAGPGAETEEALAAAAQRVCKARLSKEPPELSHKCLEALNALLESHKEDHPAGDGEQCSLFIVGRALQKELSTFIELRMN